MNTAQTTLGDLAATGAAARNVLLRYQLDFCCGGDDVLADACERAGLPVDSVLADLAAAPEPASATDWTTRSVPELIAHIVEHYHRPLPDQLNGVIAAAEKVERVHAMKPGCPHGLAAHLREIRDALLSHMAKEEGVLFPALVAGRRGQPLGGPVRVMMHEHNHHGASLAHTRKLTKGFAPENAACSTWQALYEGLAQLEVDLLAHIHLENHVLFPQALRG